MNEWYEQAAKKLEDGVKSGKYDRYAGAMKDDVYKTLEWFCRQDREFAQAVVQGGAFEDCMKAVARNCGQHISDIEAYRRAVRFYFPGADVRFHMTLNLCGDVDEECDNTEFGLIDDLDSWAARRSSTHGIKILDLEDFL